jgi:hypothetical protein
MPGLSEGVTFFYSITFNKLPETFQDMQAAIYASVKAQERDIVERSVAHEVPSGINCR